MSNANLNNLNNHSYTSSSHGLREPNDLQIIENNSVKDSIADRKLNESRSDVEQQLKSLSKNRSSSDIQVTKFAKLKNMHKNPLTENEDGEMVISAGDLVGMGRLNNVK